MNRKSRSGRPDSINRRALSATLHCLAGCSIGEVLGMALGSMFHLGNSSSIALAVILAFVFGYLLTVIPLLRSGETFRTALGLAFASDTVSIIVMEIVDNTMMLLIPGSMNAGLGELQFWASLAASMVAAGAVAFPVVHLLMTRGRGHANAHGRHSAVPDPHSTHD